MFAPSYREPIRNHNKQDRFQIHPKYNHQINLNKHLTLFRPSLILGEQDWDRASFQIGVSDLILLITEGRLRHASVPAHYNIKSVT